MGFINEKMPEEAKKTLNIDVHTRPDGSTPTLWKWTIDRERNAFLILTDTEGGAYEGTPLTRHYVLSWNESLIRMIAFRSDTIRTESGVEMTWSVRKVYLPQKLENRKTEVIKIIEDAFSTLGQSYNGEKFAKVYVDVELTGASNFGDRAIN